MDRDPCRARFGFKLGGYGRSVSGTENLGRRASCGRGSRTAPCFGGGTQHLPTKKNFRNRLPRSFNQTTKLTSVMCVFLLMCLMTLIQSPRFLSIQPLLLSLLLVSFISLFRLEVIQTPSLILVQSEHQHCSSSILSRLSSIKPSVVLSVPCPMTRKPLHPRNELLIILSLLMNTQSSYSLVQMPLF